jgi:transposase InsO family protein
MPRVTWEPPVSGRRYDTPPRNRRALEQRLRNVIADTQLQQRARRQLGYVALAATLICHARDERDEPLFLIKGGVAIELLLGLRARATKDLDAAARLAGEDIGPQLRAALAHDWEGFAFRLTGLEQVRDTAAHRGDVKVSYQGDPWSTVQLEVSPAEGTAGHQVHWAGSTFVDPERLGLQSPGELPLVTIAHHLAQEMGEGAVPSVSTIWRILRREGLVVPQPQKKPRSCLIRFCAELPNEMWQTDATHWRLADGTDVEILNVIDDHSRLFLASRAFSTVKARGVVDVFHKTADLHGLPASLLSDNGAVFTAAYRNGKVLLETELERLGVLFKNSRPYHPQTCGKIERLHQTLKRYLARQQPARTLAELQEQLDAFVHYYNTIRPHTALDGRTPLQAYSTRIKARPASETAPNTHFRVREDKVDKTGTVTLRYMSRLHHIGIGRPHKNRPIKLLIADRNIRIIDPQTGELIRELTLDPNRDYQPLGKT